MCSEHMLSSRVLVFDLGRCPWQSRKMHKMLLAGVCKWDGLCRQEAFHWVQPSELVDHLDQAFHLFTDDVSVVRYNVISQIRVSIYLPEDNWIIWRM